MKKIGLVLLIFLVIPVQALEIDNGKCITNSGYAFDEEKFVENKSYSAAVSSNYRDYALNDSTVYSKISCRELMGISTSGIINDIVAGAGFNYETKIIHLVLCQFSFDTKTFNKKLPTNKESTLYKAMSGEFNIYKEWTTNLIKNMNFSYAVTFEDGADISNTINSQTVLGKENITQIFKVGNDTLNTTKSSASLGEILVGNVGYQIEKTYIPIAKKTIISGKNYGDTVLATYKASGRCTKEENKIFTDYNLNNGNYSLKAIVKNSNKGWTIISTCGYNINNRGSINKRTRLSFRQVSLDNPFPDTPGVNFQNWKEENLISGSEFEQNPLYVVELNRASINQIRRYNDENDYLTFADLNRGSQLDNTLISSYQSKFIRETFANIFTKVGGK